MPPDSTGPLTYFGMYDRNVYKVQLLQKVATTIARKGRFVTSFKSGIERADSFDGASFKIKSNSLAVIYLLFSGKDVTFLFQKMIQKNPNIPNK